MKKFFLLSILILIVFSGISYAALKTDDLPSILNTAKNITEYNANIPTEVKVVQTLGQGMTDIMKFFVEASNKGVGYLKDFSYYCALVLGILDLTLPIMMGGMSVSIPFIIPKIMKTGFVVFAINYWNEIVNWVLSFLETITGAATGDFELASATLTQPQIILQKALQLLTPGINYASEQGIFKTAAGFVYGINIDVCILRLQTMFVLFTFMLIAAKLVLIYLQFYICAMFCIFSVPFAQIKFLKYLFENLTSGMFNSTLNLFTTLFMLHLFFLCTKNIATTDIFKEGAKIEVVLQYTKICLVMQGIAKLIDKIPKEISNTLGGQIEFN